jgi:hypothetical protein
MTRELMNRAEALERLRPLLETQLGDALREAIDELERTKTEPGAYIPRDPEVSILLSCLDHNYNVAPSDAVHAFPKGKAPRVSLGDAARLVIVGDWGSGTQRAVDVSIQMRAHLEEGLREGRDTHAISLGDVYYSGLVHEYESWFLPHWPVRPSESFGSWALNGNHDMYAGGRGYFEALLGNPRFSAQNGSSYFLLENAHWQIAGLDTAYDPPDPSGSHGNLYGNQAQWLFAHRQHRPETRTMLLTHHPLFSAFDSTGPLIARSLRPVFAQRPVDAWFWGHEHRCAIYRDPNSPVHFASLVGHGGIPVLPMAPDPSKAPVTYSYQDEYENGLTHLGFVVVDLSGSSARASYYNERGQMHYVEEF